MATTKSAARASGAVVPSVAPADAVAAALAAVEGLAAWLDEAAVATQRFGPLMALEYPAKLLGEKLDDFDAICSPAASAIVGDALRLISWTLAEMRSRNASTDPNGRAAIHGCQIENLRRAAALMSKQLGIA